MKQTRRFIKKHALLGLAALAALVLVTPGIVLAFSTTGDELGVSTSGNGYQRDHRIFNNFADSSANNNNKKDDNYPGTVGAAQALWKAADAWSSDNPLAAKNFDFDWQGDAPNANSDTNVNSATNGGSCGGGVLAYTELPTSNGWRIFYCDSWTWSDGPGDPSGSQFDIQGVGAHEMGHALGLGHSSVNCGRCNDSSNGHSTMCSFICNDGVDERTIQSDDAAGLKAVYGDMPANKPLITDLGGSSNIGGTLIIIGDNFGNDPLRVKFTAGTTKDTGDIPGVVDVMPLTPNMIAVTVPKVALTGNVLVWKHNNKRLSNYFPIEILPELPDDCYGTVYGTATPGTNGDPIISLVNPPSITGNAFLALSGSNFESSQLGFLLVSLTSASIPYKTGTTINVGFPLLFLIPVITDAAGVIEFPYPIPDDPALDGLHVYNQYLVNDSGAVDGLAGTQGMDIKICHNP